MMDEGYSKAVRKALGRKTEMNTREYAEIVS